MSQQAGNPPRRITRALRVLGLGAVALTTALVATDQPVRGLSSDLVISQVYGGGGNTGASYQNDFVELFNRGSVPVTLTGKSVQYASATGTGNFSSNNVAVLSGTLGPGQYYLVRLAGGTTGAPLPAADATGTANASGTAGKFALVNSTAGLACNGGSTVCTAGQLALIIDLVGYGTANFYEGTAAAPTLSNTTAAIRKNGGCTETDNNGADFVAGAPVPRNTASQAQPCSAPAPTPPTGVGAATPAAGAAGDPTTLTVAVTPGANPISTGIQITANLAAIGGSSTQAFFDDGTNGDVTGGDNVFSFGATVPPSTTTGAKLLPVTVSDAEARSSSTSITYTVLPPPQPIHAIQGSGSSSPIVGQSVTTRGVVTARRFNNGFFIQTPDELADGDPSTSEAIFVYTAAAPPAAAAVGTYVQVSGTAFEYVPTTDTYSPPVTEIVSPTVTALAASYPMPAAVTLTAAHFPLDGAPDQLEYLEGMRVHVPFLRVVAPTDGNVTESTATSSSNGVFHAVIDGVGRPFREAGIQVPDPLPAGAPPTVPRFDGNPERLRVNSWGQIDALRIDVATGALVSNTVGVLDYAYRTWTILPDAGAPPAVSGGATVTPVPVPDENEFTVASFNLERFFDNVNDPAIGEPVLTAAAFNNRLNKASLAVRNVMQMPDILGVQEVENLSTLQTLAARINADAVAAGGSNPGYVAYLQEGNDVGGIDVGFLVKGARVDVLSVVQEGKSATFTNPLTGLLETLNDRPPLVLEATVHGPLGSLPVTVVVNHLRSLLGLEDPAGGARVRAKRLAQAEFLASLVQARQVANPSERIILVGDFNAFEVSDGYVDVIASIKGTPTPASDVVLTGPDLVDPDLIDLALLVPAGDRYSYSFDGNAQVLDHVIVNSRAMMRFARMHYGRSNADFPETLRNDAERPERLSDHDPAVAYFAFPDAPILQLTGSNPQTVECCGSFVDPGATAFDIDFGDLTSAIAVTGSVDAHTVGAYALTYTVSSPYTTTTVTRTVNVVDTTPPALTLAGANPMTVELGSFFVDPGATASDTCAGDLSNWILVSGAVNTSAVGTYQVTYTVSDGYNTTAVTRFVNVVDTTPPAVSVIVPSPDSLWPPNHRMVNIGLSYSFTDNSGAASCTVGVVSNEPDNGTGDGDTAPDWFVTSPTAVQLRGERAGNGTGREYTITVTCRDASGNAGIGRGTVSVPHSKGK